MVPLTSLLLPVLLGAVFVFIASSLLHMFLGYHGADHRTLPSEDRIAEALRAFDIPPGDYMLPRPASMAAMRTEEHKAKLRSGPVAVLTVMKPGLPQMGAHLTQWFLYSLVVDVFAAYIAGRALGPGAPALQVLRFAGTTAFIAYAVALWQDSIWYKRAWGTSIRYTIDGLVYGIVVGATFAWLWPR